MWIRSILLSLDASVYTHNYVFFRGILPILDWDAAIEGAMVCS